MLEAASVESSGDVAGDGSGQQALKVKSQFHRSTVLAKLIWNLKCVLACLFECFGGLGGGPGLGGVWSAPIDAEGPICEFPNLWSLVNANRQTAPLVPSALTALTRRIGVEGDPGQEQTNENTQKTRETAHHATARKNRKNSALGASRRRASPGPGRARSFLGV